jgi:hypothetical protein
MSIGPMNPIAASVIGSTYGMNRASDIERTQQDSTSQEVRLESAEKAETASDVGETDGRDSQTSERDGDGRRPWEFRRGRAKGTADAPPADPHLPKDPTGLSGNALDLTG